MRTFLSRLAGATFVVAIAAQACSSTGGSGFGDGGAGSSGSSGSGGSAGSGASAGAGGGDGFGGSGGAGGSDGSMDSGSMDTGGVTTTTIYANTDSALYTLDPSSMAVTLIGKFSVTDTMTDVAVDAEGDVYVNSESTVYLATIPKTADGGVGTGTVTLSNPVTIGSGKDQYFYALAFAPKGFLGSGETLVGGDSNGEIWSIDPSSGAVQDLGNFGPVFNDSSKIFALSGDMVFYTSGGTATGLATIRECTKSSGDCDTDNDYLAGIDMTALQTAYTSSTPATSLLSGIYGGSANSAGPGTGFGEVYGLGAWEGSVYGFTRAESKTPPQLISINTTTGAGTSISSSFGFTSDGWSGAGVATSTIITVPKPPPPPK